MLFSQKQLDFSFCLLVYDICSCRAFLNQLSNYQIVNLHSVSTEMQTKTAEDLLCSFLLIIVYGHLVAQLGWEIGPSQGLYLHKTPMHKERKVRFEPMTPMLERYTASGRNLHHNSVTVKGKCTAVPLQAWSWPEGSRKLRFPDFMTTAQDGGKVVSFTHRPPLPPGNTPGTHFC